MSKIWTVEFVGKFDSKEGLWYLLKIFKYYIFLIYKFNGNPHQL